MHGEGVVGLAPGASIVVTIIIQRFCSVTGTTS